LVSDFIAGKTLAEQLMTWRPDFRQTADLVAQIGDALECAHQEGVIHRDVKPSNILIDPNGRPHLTDFGLAKHDAIQTTLTCEGQLLGTPAYMSPEQARGDANRVDPRTDVYSLGVVLYELLTGTLPFRGPARIVLLQVLEDEPSPPRRLNERIPRDLDTICLKCLDKEPARRYPSAAAMTKDLRLFLAGEPIRARPTSRLRRTVKWALRRPTVAALTALSLVLVIALLIAGAFFTLELGRRIKFATQQQHIAENQRQSAQQATALARRRLYSAEMSLALHEWQRGNVETAVHLLERQYPHGDEPDPRTFEWHYLWRLCHQDAVLRGHTGAVNAVAFSAGGSRIASAGDDHTIRIWDLPTRGPAGVLTGHDGPVSSLALSPDGRILASAGDDRTVRLWDLETLRERQTLHGHANKVTVVAFAPNGKWLATASLDGVLRLWDVASGKVSGLYNHGGDKAHLDRAVVDIAFTPDSRLMVTGTQFGRIRVWDISAGQLCVETVAHNNTLTCVKLAPDGKTLATGSDDRTIKLWDVATLGERGVLGAHSEGISALAFSNVGPFASASLDGNIKLWEVGKRSPQATMSGHTGAVLAAAFAPDGRTLATAGRDGTIRLWDPQAGKVRKNRLEPQRWPADVASLGDRIAWKWSDGSLLAVAFTPDGKALAAAGRSLQGWGKASQGVVRIWDVATGTERAVYRERGAVYAFTADPHQGLLAIGRSTDGQVGRLVFWDPPSDSRRLSPGETCVIYSLALSPDGRTVATAGGFTNIGGEVVLWDVATGEARSVHKEEGDYARAVAWAPDGQSLAVARGDGRVTLWDADLHEPRLDFQAHEGRIYCMAFAPDGSLLATASRDGTAKLWQPATGRLVSTLRGHAQSVSSLAFSPDGETIATGGGDGSVKLWDPLTGQERLTLLTHAGRIWGVAFHPDGQTLAAGSEDGTMTLWQASGQ
jgi:WD40 repeat protein